MWLAPMEKSLKFRHGQRSATVHLISRCSNCLDFCIVLASMNERKPYTASFMGTDNLFCSSAKQKGTLHALEKCIMLLLDSSSTIESVEFNNL